MARAPSSKPTSRVKVASAQPGNPPSSKLQRDGQKSAEPSKGAGRSLAQRKKVSRPATKAPARNGSKSTPREAPKEPAHGLIAVDRPVPTAFPVVGIGASAGGLEALETFLRHVPHQSGMAFVVVQHLDPSHKGSLVEILQRATKMPVIQVKDHQPLLVDNVFVIPPGKDMSTFHGQLHLLEQATPRGLNLPIDFFFRSLAEDLQEKAIGVLLSGAGSDGTLGLRAMKEKAGASFVQSPASAKFDGMPRSAIDAGVADVIAPVEELPARIVAYRQHVPYIARDGHEPPIDEKAKTSIEQVFGLLRSHTGSDFSLYKKSTIQRRIERRMGLHQIEKIEKYVRYMREHPREIDLLFRELLIGVTSFFRDSGPWDYLRDEALPALLARRPDGELLRAWVPGCSTGEEAYSLAIVFREALDALKPSKNLMLQIFATDLDNDAIERARGGVYPINIAQDVTPERLRRFFVQDDLHYRIAKDIREMVVFAPQNIIMDPPFTKLDILTCRNLLIYLGSELQQKLIPLFHYSLNRNGVLFLGSAETIGAHSGLFTPVEAKWRVYRRLEAGVGAVPVEFPVAFTARPSGHSDVDSAENTGHPPPNLPALVHHLLVQNFAPAAVLTSDKGDILYVSGRTGKYLEPAAGKANLNIFAMARQGLRLELTTAFSKALREGRRAVVHGVKVGTNGGTQTIDLAVQKLTEPRELRGTMLVVFTDVHDGAQAVSAPPRPPVQVAGARLHHLEKELHRAQDEIQITREEMQTSQEELKSTNEELQSTNEELQSTNEELTTSKEEMQSMNEELQTVNHELHGKLDELSRSNNDMKNLLNSTDIATLFLDSDLRVRRFTTPISSIIKLIPGDIGRPITDIARDIEYPELVDDAREVLRTLVYKETLVAATRDRWFAVRIIPYRTVENVIDGVVITFNDAAMTRAMETQLREQAGELRQMADSLPHLLMSCRSDGTCDSVSAQWTVYTGIPSAELLGHGWLHAVDAADRERVRNLWQLAVTNESVFETELRIRSKEGDSRWFRARLVPIRGADGKINRWYGSHTEVDELKNVIADRDDTNDQLKLVIKHIQDPVFLLSGDDSIAYANPAGEKLAGRPASELEGKSLLQIFPKIDSDLFAERRNAARLGKDGVAIVQLTGSREPFAMALAASGTQMAVTLRPAPSQIVDRRNDGNPKGSL
jgi:two-component system CheB/CheR fusion protein